MLLKIANSKV